MAKKASQVSKTSSTTSPVPGKPQRESTLVVMNEEASELQHEEGIQQSGSNPVGQVGIAREKQKGSRKSLKAPDLKEKKRESLKDLEMRSMLLETENEPELLY